jgi:hypothetical protein
MRGVVAAVCANPAERDYQRERYRRRRGLPVEEPVLSAVSSPRDSSDGLVVTAVRAEVDAAPSAAERPGLAAVALALAAILDNPKHVPTQPAAARQIVAILDQLSKRTRHSGRLAAVRAMSTGDSTRARS